MKGDPVLGRDFILFFGAIIVVDLSHVQHLEISVLAGCPVVVGCVPACISATEKGGRLMAWQVMDALAELADIQIENCRRVLILCSHDSFVQIEATFFMTTDKLRRDLWEVFSEQA